MYVCVTFAPLATILESRLTRYYIQQLANVCARSHLNIEHLLRQLEKHANKQASNVHQHLQPRDRFVLIFVHISSYIKLEQQWMNEWMGKKNERLNLTRNRSFVVIEHAGVLINRIKARQIMVYKIEWKSANKLHLHIIGRSDRAISSDTFVQRFLLLYLSSSLLFSNRNESVVNIEKKQNQVHLSRQVQHLAHSHTHIHTHYSWQSIYWEFHLSWSTSFQRSCHSASTYNKIQLFGSKKADQTL